MLNAENLKAETITKREDIERIITFWRDNAYALDSDPDFFLKILDIRENIISPFLIYITENNKPISLLVARLERKKLSAKIGYFKLLSVGVRSINVNYGGFIGVDTPTTRNIMIKTLLKNLEDGVADLVFFHMLHEDSHLFQDLDSCNIKSWRIQKSLPSMHYEMKCPESPSDVLEKKSSKIRKRLNYEIRKVERSLVNPKLTVDSSGEKVDDLMDELELVTSKTYQRRLGVGFVKNAEWRAILEVGFEKKWLDVWKLLECGKCISYIIGFTYSGRHLIYAKAFDPDYANLSVGKYHQINVLKELAGRNNCKLVDYGFGDAAYKKQFSTNEWRERNISISSSTIFSLFVHLYIKLALSMDLILRTILAKMGLTDRIKKFLRKNHF